MLPQSIIRHAADGAAGGGTQFPGVEQDPSDDPRTWLSHHQVWPVVDGAFALLERTAALHGSTFAVAPSLTYEQFYQRVRGGPGGGKTGGAFLEADAQIACTTGLVQRDMRVIRPLATFYVPGIRVRIYALDSRCARSWQAGSLAHYLTSKGVHHGARMGVICGNSNEVRRLLHGNTVFLRF